MAIDRGYGIATSSVLADSYDLDALIADTEAAKTAALAAQVAAELAETNAETAETNAETAETNAETAETNAETAETNAETAETNAAASATTATTQATNAATSATSAATSATTATTQASTATTKASEASTSATNAATSATGAATSATTATTQATTATTQATTATTQASAASTSATAAATSATAAATSATNAATSATTASTQATNAATSATTATTQASTATTQATTATTQATTATTQATNAASSATAAAASATAAATSADNMDDIYLGAKASDPALDNDGDALTTGDWYFNTASNLSKIYNGSSFTDVATSFDGAVTINESGADVDFRVESDTNTHALFVQGSDGNVGIGTDDPAEELDISADAPSIQLSSTNASGRNYGLQSDNTGKFAFYDGTAGANRMVIDSSGNVGIGTTPETDWISNGTAIDIEDGSLISNSTTGGGHWTSSNNAKQTVNNYLTGWQYKSTDEASQHVQVNGTHVFKVAPSNTADTSITWTTAMTIENDADVTVNSGNLVIGTAGKGIDFSADSDAGGMTSELLDDYEVGTWTPTASGGASLNSAIYTKIGNLVHCQGTLTFPSQTNSGAALVESLPFTATSFSHGFTGSVRYTDYITGNPTITGNYNTTTFGIYLGTNAVSWTNMSGLRFDFDITYRTS